MNRPDSDAEPMPIARAAQLALDVQNAVNLSGVAQTFAEVLTQALWPEARRIGEGTRWVNEHPICTMFLDKLQDLNGRGDYGTAYEVCKALAKC